MAEAGTPSWWHSARRRVYLDFHIPDHADQAPPGTPRAYRKVNPRAIAAAAADAGAQALVFYARDNQGNSYYPTDLGHQLSDLGGRDLVAEFIEALHEHGIRAVAYFQPIRDRRAWDAVPAWRQVNNDGSYRVHNPQLQLGMGGHKLVCPLGLAGEAVLAELKDLVSRYDLDGVWWDRVGDVFGTNEVYACLCDSCKRQFRAETGMDIPTAANWDSPAWRAFYSWRAASLLRFQRRAHEVVRRHGRGAALISNYAFFGMSMADPAVLAVDWEAISDATDVAALEFQHSRSYLHMSTHPMLMRALTDRPVEIITWNNGHIGDGFVRSSVAMEASAHTTLARGHAVTVHDTVDYEGNVDPRFWELARHVFARARAIEPGQKGARPLTYAAILFSPSSYTWYSRGMPEGYVQEFMGTTRQLIETHVPLEMLSERHLTLEALEGYRLLVLPDAGCLSDRAAEVLREWVSRGGTLFASHQTSRWTEAGARRPDFALADVFGVHYERAMPAGPRWMRATPGPLEPAWGPHPVALWTGAAAVRADSARVLAHFGQPLPGLDTFPHFVWPAREWGPEPAVTLAEFGQGRALYVAGCLGQGDLQLGVPELSGPLRLAVELAGPAPVAAEAPASVELIAQERADGGWLVHLVNFPGEIGRAHRMPGIPPRTQGVRGVIPVHDITLHFDRPVKGVRSLLDDLEPHVESSGTTVVLPRLDVSAVLAIDF